MGVADEDSDMPMKVKTTGPVADWGKPTADFAQSPNQYCDGATCQSDSRHSLNSFQPLEPPCDTCATNPIPSSPKWCAYAGGNHPEWWKETAATAEVIVRNRASLNMFVRDHR
jgi:hypothetical protein